MRDDIEDGPLTKLLNAANALRAVSGLELVGCAITREKVQAKVRHSEYGHFLAEVTNPEVLFEAADSLIAEGAQAIAAVTEIGGVTEEDLISHYFHSGPNPVGSMEALISRAITLKSGVPCAHAPVFSEGLGGISRLVDPRASAEPAPAQVYLAFFTDFRMLQLPIRKLGCRFRIFQPSLSHTTAPVDPLRSPRTVLAFR